VGTIAKGPDLIEVVWANFVPENLVTRLEVEPRT